MCYVVMYVGRSLSMYVFRFLAIYPVVFRLFSLSVLSFVI